MPRRELPVSLALLVRSDVVPAPLRLELLVVSDEPLVPVPLAVAPLALLAPLLLLCEPSRERLDRHVSNSSENFLALSRRHAL